jgi:DNA-binding IclR family transcriptional regulator
MAVSDNKKGAKSSTVHSVVVASKLLEFLADSGRPQRVTDIAAFLGMTKARVSRHLSTLSDLGMVAKMPDKSGYRLGPTLFRLSNAALDQYEITNIAYRYMVVLRNQISEAILLAIPAGGDALVVSTISSGKPLSPQLVRGTRWSIPTSPSASIILAFSPDFVRERVLARRKNPAPVLCICRRPARGRLLRRICTDIRSRRATGSSANDCDEPSPGIGQPGDALSQAVEGNRDRDFKGFGLRGDGRQDGGDVVATSPPASLRPQRCHANQAWLLPAKS